MDATVKKRKARFSVKDFFTKSLNLIGRKIGWVMFAFFLVSTSLCVYMWYSFVYNSQWSDSRKQKYIDTQDKNVTFDLSKFREIVADSEKRKQEFSKKEENVNDIFRLNQ